MPLARVDESEVEERDQQHLPIQLHMTEQPAPIDCVVALQDHVGDVRHIVAVMILDEDLRPNELRRWNELDGRAKQLRFRRIDEPFIGDVGGDGRHVGNDVDEQVAARDAIEPAFIDDLHVEPALLAKMEHFQRVAGLGENVHILGRAVDAGVARQRISARDQERDARFRHQLEHFGIEGLGRGCRPDQGAVGPGRGCLLVHAAAQREGGAAGSFPVRCLLSCSQSGDDFCRAVEPLR